MITEPESFLAILKVYTSIVINSIKQNLLYNIDNNFCKIYIFLIINKKKRYFIYTSYHYMINYQHFNI